MQTRKASTSILCALFVLFFSVLTPAQNAARPDGPIIIGSIVPASGSLAGVGQSIEGATTAFFTELNSKGGINGRLIELRFVETGASAEDTRKNLEKFLETEHIFALTGAFIAGAENEILTVVQQRHIPLVGPITLYPKPGNPVNREVFYVLSGLDIQARVVADFLNTLETLKSKNVGIVYRDNERDSTIADAIKDQLKKLGLSAPAIYLLQPENDDIALVKQMRADNRQFLFVLTTPDRTTGLLKAMQEIAWFPHVYLSAVNANGTFEWSPEFNEKIFLAFPTAPVDITAEAVAEYSLLSEKYKIPTQNQALQLAALAGAKILVEALKRSGKDLTHDKLIQSLESISNFSTGFSPPVSYGPTRRIGAQGAYVIKLDLANKKFLPAWDWHTVN